MAYSSSTLRSTSSLVCVVLMLQLVLSTVSRGETDHHHIQLQLGITGRRMLVAGSNTATLMMYATYK
ncbi:hypothetical protein E2562_003489 [Oryza meyeriana var. granulata]|uniref:Uncharacterized protein n=1 Tax=Oryza meyeriana var. granulata TaxID=110450 RepID=A0A6G1CLG6_9ORYZ|nr:hypothetical protein E2562_003489 [Oryza meyeriana var. granulata]